MSRADVLALANEEFLQVWPGAGSDASFIPRRRS
jgi:hypothetical protein